MKFKKKKIYNTALHMAVEKGDPDIVQILLKHPSINVNVISVLKFFFIHVI